jgi:hypothetical protein
LGPVGARGGSGSGGGSGWSRTRDASLEALDAFIAQCMASPSPQRHSLLRRRLGKDLLKFLSGCTAGSNGGSGGGRGRSRFLLVAPTVCKLLHRVYALFFLSSGYEAEDAVVLLRNDMGGLRFIDMVSGQPPRPQPEPQHEAEEEANKKEEETAAAAAVSVPLPVTRISPRFRPLMDHLLALLDTFDAAVQSGDGPLAYACLHQAADFFLPPPEPRVSTTAVDVDVALAAASSAGPCSDGGGQAAAVERKEEVEGEVEARWESVIEVLDDEDEDDDVIVIEPDGQPTAAPSCLSLAAAAASSSSSLSAPVSVPHRNSLPFPLGYRGLQDLPTPLLKMALKVLGRCVLCVHALCACLCGWVHG